MQILISMVSPKEFEELKEEFSKLDVQGRGAIPIADVKSAVAKIHPDMPDAELTRIITDCDADGNGLIDYNEFINATFPVDKFAS